MKTVFLKYKLFTKFFTATLLHDLINPVTSARPTTLLHHRRWMHTRPDDAAAGDDGDDDDDDVTEHRHTKRWERVSPTAME